MKENTAAILAISFLVQLVGIASTTVKSKVLILGGGPAGLGFANRLHEQGENDFLVLEAHSFLGGRVKDIKFGNMTIQEGANWIHDIGDANSIYKLKQKYGLATTPDNYTDFIVRDLSGSVVNGSKATYDFLRKKIEELYSLVEKMEKNKEHDIPLKTAFKMVGWKPMSPLEKAMDYYLNDFENEASPSELSAWSVGFTGEGKDEIVIDQRGYAYVLREQAKSFSSKIHLNTVVKKISYDEKKVTVETANGTLYEANYAYVTFSTGVLASSNVVFNPALPDWKMKAVFMLPMNYYTKIFLKFSTKFWDNNRYILVANEDRGHYVHFMNLDRPGLFPDKKMLLATVTDRESLRVEKLNDQQVKDEVFAILKKVYPSATAPTDIHLSRWSLDNTTYGAYSSPVIGSDKYSYLNLKAPVKKTLWFGGEAATDVEMFGYAHGAYSGGVSQANQLLECMGDSSKCPVYKPREPPKTCSSGVRNNLSSVLFMFIASFALLM